MEWSEVLNHPLLQNLPFKIELNRFGQILMSPASNRHGNLQYTVAEQIKRAKRRGTILMECSIQNAPSGQIEKSGLVKSIKL